MAAPVQDVLSGGGASEGRRPSRALVAALAAVAAAALAAVAAAALVTLVVQQDTEPRGSGTVELTGSLRFDDTTSRRVELPSGVVEERDGTARGSVRLELPDGVLVGRATFAYDARILGTGPEYALHTWGDAHLQFDEDDCEGTFGWSNLEEPLEGGGALHVRCEDGTTFAGRLAATAQSGPDTVVDVRDGWYRAGEQ